MEQSDEVGAMKRRGLCAVCLVVSLTAHAASTPAPSTRQPRAPTAAASQAVAVPSTPASMPTSAIPQFVVNVPKQESSPWYQEVWKTLIGTFLGALLAFVSAVIHRRAQQRNTDIAAGNMALFYLRAMQRQ